MAVKVHSPRGICARAPWPALHDAPPALRARGLAVWVAPRSGLDIDAEVLARAARLVLERALKFAPEAEVHWPAAEAATSAAPTEEEREHEEPEQEEPEEVRDGGSRLPPSAGPVHYVSVDLAAGQVLLDGSPVGLTGVEYRVLRYLVENCSRPVGREELQEFLESFESPGASARSIDVYVGRVRRKLGNARHAVATVRGGGYRFIPGASATVRGPAEYSI